MHVAMLVQQGVLGLVLRLGEPYHVHPANQACREGSLQTWAHQTMEESLHVTEEETQ